MRFLNASFAYQKAVKNNFCSLFGLLICNYFRKKYGWHFYSLKKQYIAVYLLFELKKEVWFL